VNLMLIHMGYYSYWMMTLLDFYIFLGSVIHKFNINVMHKQPVAVAQCINKCVSTSIIIIIAGVYSR